MSNSQKKSGSSVLNSNVKALKQDRALFIQENVSRPECLRV